MKATMRMPRVADSTDTFIVTEWSVAVGQQIAEGDALMSVETDKAVVSVPAAVSGTVVELLVAEDDEVTTGQPIVVVDVP
jgi:pyruvate/2-oxoglutarate dehydrogenase complex dihydrolipoamide acyltransferase (E2) component